MISPPGGMDVNFPSMYVSAWHVRSKFRRNPANASPSVLFTTEGAPYHRALTPSLPKQCQLPRDIPLKIQGDGTMGWHLLRSIPGDVWGNGKRGCNHHAASWHVISHYVMGWWANINILAIMQNYQPISRGLNLTKALAELGAPSPIIAGSVKTRPMQLQLFLLYTSPSPRDS